MAYQHTPKIFHDPLKNSPQKRALNIQKRTLNIRRGVCHHATSRPPGTVIIYFRRALAVIHRVYKMYLIDVSSSDVPLFQSLKLFLLQLHVQSGTCSHASHCLLNGPFSLLKEQSQPCIFSNMYLLKGSLLFDNINCRYPFHVSTKRSILSSALCLFHNTNWRHPLHQADYNCFKRNYEILSLEHFLEKKNDHHTQTHSTSILL